MTAEQLRDYCEWHVQTGRGSCPVEIDNRGLGYLVQPEFRGETLGLALPPDDEMCNPATGKIFLRVVF